LLPLQPGNCIEVISPDNTDAEIREKMALYFDAGARETWICGMTGVMTFFASGLTRMDSSKLCPAFPHEIEFH